MWILAIAALLAPFPPQERPKPPPEEPAGPAAGRRARVDDKGPPVLPFDDVPQEEGAHGDLPPLARRIELGVASVDLDSTGLTRRELADLRGAGDGFVLLASDERDGSRAYVLQRLDAAAATAGEPERVDAAPSGRGQYSGSLAIAAGNVHGAVWLDADDHETFARARLFGWQGRAFAGAWPSSLPGHGGGDSAGGGVPPLRPEPALAWTPEESFLVWNARGRIVLRELHPGSGRTIRERALGRASLPALSGPTVALAADGALACAFDAGGGSQVHYRLSAELYARTDAGPGKVVGLAADARAEGGWWLALRRQGQLVLRHFDRGGAPDRADVALVEQGWRFAELAAGPSGAAAIAQTLEGGLIAVWTAGAEDSTPGARTELAPPGAQVIAAKIACNGERWAFAWSERRANEVDLVARASGWAGADLTERRVLGGGEGSAHQVQPAVAAAGERGLVAWTDLRFAESSIGVRGFAAGRKLAARELFLPAELAAEGVPEKEPATPAEPADPSAPSAPEGPGAPHATGSPGEPGAPKAPTGAARRPAVGLLPSGAGLVAWLGEGAAGPAVLAQLLAVGEDGDVTVRTPAFELDPGSKLISAGFPPAVLALRDGRGFAVAWVRASAGTRENPRVSEDDGRSELRVVRVSANGLGERVVRTVGAGPRLSRPSLAQLDDGRIAVAWDAQPRAKALRLAVRVLSERLDPEPRELAFETMWRGSDHSPSIAPAKDGFALAWTSGEPGESDVFARRYDFDGRPLSRPIALSTRAGTQAQPSLVRTSDGRHVVAWIDDLSGRPRFVARAFTTSGPSGSAARFSLGPEARVQDCANPRLVALEGNRLLAVGDHPVEGRGREVGLCLAGLGWEQLEGR